MPVGAPPPRPRPTPCSPHRPTRLARRCPCRKRAVWLGRHGRSPAPAGGEGAGEPAADGAVNLGRDINALFRPHGHEAMALAFELSSFDDRKAHDTPIPQP